MKKPYKDEALLVAHLLGGRYGYEHQKSDDETMQEHVAAAIAVAREIQRQLDQKDVGTTASSETTKQMNIQKP